VDHVSDIPGVVGTTAAAPIEDRTERPPAVSGAELRAADRHAAFETLYREEHAAMVRLAFLMTGEQEGSVDIVHDSFAKVYERWELIDRPGAYLRTAVVNGCRDHERRRRFRRRVHLPVPEPEQLEADELADALARLSARQRAAIVLRYYEDVDEAGIAEVLRVRPGTVKSLLSRGLTSLASALADGSEQPGEQR
jgi:RNA polymerase sigma factor (sigma-70 family)